ncbi:hypothetical protein OV203_45225 [Nannocystis sp. ILAH1]|uniref:hypothetical protein n=1 Tax=unclassified Nannocystis TaxID=2627009 RepID=UPI002270C836|nr:MULTISPECIES: hypothetical protein [unclassified Nannocystis]MCY0994413.1 hypothetical protein [Nannocystis sp. ILAH1]MCY1063499.1 hypothetical protein [Nannocystis sp. RBIL2]
MFSHDGTRHAAGGGSWYGEGGILPARTTEQVVEALAGLRAAAQVDAALEAAGHAGFNRAGSMDHA